VVIARALVNDPKVIFADEPTGNLDTATGEVVEDILFDLNREQGITLVIVTHDPELAARCDRQIYLRDGLEVDAPPPANTRGRNEEVSA
jgi:putative ABC transport system ATP-binding protein